jgi:hypothetical protein
MMNSTRFALLPRVPALVLITFAASVAQATPRCENPSFAVDRVACAKAKESPESLRRFITRTQSIYSLYFWDYMSERELERHHARRQAPDQQPTRDATASAETAGAR